MVTFAVGTEPLRVCADTSEAPAPLNHTQMVVTAFYGARAPTRHTCVTAGEEPPCGGAESAKPRSPGTGKGRV